MSSQESKLSRFNHFFFNCKENTIPDDVFPYKIESKGNYAVAIVWSDGHKSSIYPYSRLLSNEIPEKFMIADLFLHPSFVSLIKFSRIKLANYMSDDLRAFLDELFGKERNVTHTKRKNDVHYWDDNVEYLVLHL
jgi:hypothetical protein